MTSEPPPLPAPHVEALRWHGSIVGVPVWFAYAKDGQLWIYRPGAREWQVTDADAHGPARLIVCLAERDRELLSAREELELLRHGRASASDAREAAEHALRTSSVRLAEVAPFVCGFCAGDAFARKRGGLSAAHDARTAGTAAREGGDE